MKRILLCLTASVVVVVAAACSGGGGKGGTNPPGTLFSYTPDGSGFGGDNGEVVLFRLYQGASVAYCSTSETIGGNSFNFTLTSALEAGVSYHGEIIVNQDGNSTYDAGDLTYFDPPAGGVFTTTGDRDWTINQGTEQTGLSWPIGEACP